MLLHTRELPWWKKKKDGHSRSGGANSRKRLQARGGVMEGRRYADESDGQRARVAAHLLP